MSQAVVRGLQKGVKKLPDVWPDHPEIVRDLLREAGFSCGVEPRILQGRDPDWTCIIDGLVVVEIGSSPALLDRG
jgi:hypothetical protein